MPRTFASASSEKIDLALGAGGSLTGAFTIAAIIKIPNNVGQTPVCIGNVSATRRNITITNTGLVGLRGNNTNSNGSTAIPNNAWALIAGNKAAGLATPRLHIYAYTTGTWTHENSGTAQNDSTPSGASILGANNAGAFMNGDLAIGGAWAAAFTDAQIESLAYGLTAWFQAPPNGLWVLDQSSTGMLVNDLTGNGANQSGITGTAVSTNNVPVFSYGAPIMVDTYAVAPISIALSPATITVTGVALAVTTGGVSVALSPATITDTPVSLTISAAVSLALSPATITITPVGLTPTMGDATVALSPAAMTVTPVAMSPTTGGVSLTLSPATITVTPVALAPSAGAVSLALPPAHIAVSPEGACALTDEDGRELTDEDGRVLVGSSSCNNLGVSAPTGDQTAALTPATITVTPVALTTAAAVSLALSPAVITISPVGLAVTGGATSVALSPVEITVTPVALTVTLAGQLALSPAVVTVTPAAVTLVAAVDLALGTATITVTPVGLAPSVGAVTVQLSPALIAVLAVALEFAPGVGCIHLTLDELGTIEATVAPLHACAVTLGPHAVTVVLSVPHACTVTLSELGTITAELEECAP